MAYPRYPGEIEDQVTLQMNDNDHNNAGQFLMDWTPIALVGTAITVPGDGKYIVTYTGSQTLETVNGLTNGRPIMLRADVTGAGGPGNALALAHGTGNIYMPGGVNGLLQTDYEWALFVFILDRLTGAVQYYE